MLKVESNLGWFGSPPISLPLRSLPLPAISPPGHAILLHLIHLVVPSPPLPISSLLFPPPSILLFPQKWPDAGNFMTVDLFTFLQSWERMNIYAAGLSLRGICLYSLLIWCVFERIISMIPCVCSQLHSVCSSAIHFKCVLLSASSEQLVCVTVCTAVLYFVPPFCEGARGRRWRKPITILWGLNPHGAYILSFLSLNAVYKWIIFRALEDVQGMNYPEFEAISTSMLGWYSTSFLTVLIT